eukprot:RCo047629
MTNLPEKFSQDFLISRSRHDPVCTFLLGVARVQGWWALRSEAKARRLFQDSSSSLDVARLVLVLWLPHSSSSRTESKGGEKGSAAMDALQVLASQGDTLAQWAVALTLLGSSAGRHSHRHLKKVSGALPWLQKSENFALSQYLLGQLYLRGAPGISVDQPRALGYYRRAAEQGLCTAQAALGHCLRKGY